LKLEANKHHATHANARRQINKFFWNVKVGDVDRSKPFNCETIYGSHNMHQICSVSHKDPTLLQVHEISCFCVACINRSLKEKCENELHVHPWTLKRLKPCNSLEARNIMFDHDEEVE